MITVKQYFEDLAYHLRGSASMINHRHQNPHSYEIIQIVSGEGNAFMLDRTYPLRDGMLLLIDAASLHCITPLDVSNYCRNKLIIDKQYLTGIFEAMHSEQIFHSLFYPQEGRCFYLTHGQAQEVDRMFQNMKKDDYLETEQYHVKIIAAIMNIFSICCQTTELAIPDEDDKLTQVMQYLRLHFSEQLSVEKVSESAHMSKYYLCHLFRQKTGLTLMQYLYEQRLTEARSQLLHTSCSISEIAMNCGFSSSSHFCTLFKKREGMNPSEYRKRAVVTLTTEKTYSKINLKKGS